MPVALYEQLMGIYANTAVLCIINHCRNTVCKILPLTAERTKVKKKFAFVITYACVAFLGGVGLMILLLAEKAPRASEKENRMLAGFPSLSFASLADGSFMTGLEDYLSDAMFDRDGIVDATSRISAVFSLDNGETSLEEDVAAFAEEDADTAGKEEDIHPNTEAGLPAGPEQIAADGLTAQQTESEQEETAVTEPSDVLPPEEEGISPEDGADGDGDDVDDPNFVEDGEDYDPFDQTNDPDGWRKGAFWQIRPDGSVRKVYNFPKNNLKNAVKVLNAYRAILPEDGKIYFAQIPFRDTGLGLASGAFIGWGCNVEQILSEHTDDGVVIVSTPDVLEPHFKTGEYLYFRTDHHWTPRAASLLAQAFLETQGVATYGYDDYRYTTRHNFYGSHATTAKQRAGLKADDLDILIPSLPTESYTIDAKGKQSGSVYMVERSSYLAYLGGTLGPWRRFVSGAHTGRSCLVIGDSYSNCFIPFLMPYYDDVYSVDMRSAYLSKAKAGCTVTEFVQQHGISDIYFIPSTASSINSGYMLNYLWMYL